MISRRFTDRYITSLRPRAARYEVWESSGFGLRVSPGGAKSWIWMYRFDGRARRLTLGTYPLVGLADAHLKLAQARQLLSRGQDPGRIEQHKRRLERDAPTVAELAEDYLNKWARLRKRSAATDERILKKDVVPAWGKRKAQDIARRDVIALLDAIVERGSPIMANRSLAVVRRMFRWAIERDLLQTSPAFAVKAPARESRRDRVLSTSEIIDLWAGLDRLAPLFALPLKLMLVSGQRKSEVVSAAWSEIDRCAEVWTIPAERSKNGLPHRVPLSPIALAVLDDAALLPQRGTGSQWVFPSPRSTLPLNASAIDKAVRRYRRQLGVADFTPHDLRRSAASGMTSIGVSRLVVSKILNHAEPGVTAVYDRHSYDAEKRAALAAWGARLKEIIGTRDLSENIVALRATV